MTASLKISDDVVESVVEDKVVLLHVESGLYFSLDATGAMIWHHIKAGTPLGTIPELLAQTVDADVTQIERDVQAFLAELFTNKILKRM